MLVFHSFQEKGNYYREMLVGLAVPSVLDFSKCCSGKQ